MKKQMLIVISREFGSGGCEIAGSIARRFRLPLYDKNILEQIAKSEGVNADTLKKYDEAPRNFFTSRSINGFCNSPTENVARMQFDYLQSKARTGESFVVMGRCGEEVLREYPGLISFFILADIDFKTDRIMKRYNLSEDDAIEMISRTDRRRRYYHDQYCRGKWGDPRNYDLCINSGVLGIDKSTELLVRYIRMRTEDVDRLHSKA